MKNEIGWVSNDFNLSLLLKYLCSACINFTTNKQLEGFGHTQTKLTVAAHMSC